GAMTTQRSVETSSLVRSGWPLLAEAYRRVATVRIRNQATVGGGLAHADPNQDPPPALLVLDASVTLASATGDRTVPVSALWTGYLETSIRPGEVLTGVTVPPQSSGGWAYLKFLPRTEDDYATVSVATLVQLDQAGVCSDARVAVGSAGPTPIRAVKAEALLRGERPSDTLLRQVAEQAREEVDPIADFRGSAEYKRDMAAVFVRRALQQAVERAGR
ncbi:MAG: xanthine dehydrogenase family protein subunit M, partial [SAR202 cluster bacterium]|nr:xanthine dehydrogenase family protein subunit M [SAR202 cluster bacterium]